MKIVYVTYEMPGANRFPGPQSRSAMETSGFGSIRHWFSKLDPKTARSPNIRYPASTKLRTISRCGTDGMIWFSEQADDTDRQRIGDAQITRYRAPSRGTKHTLVVDSKGMVWLRVLP